MDRLAVLFLMGYAAVRLLFAATFPLAADEAYYWQWSRHLDLGYYDQGPLIAWLIRLGTLILGDTELGVRLPGILANLGAGYVVYRYGRDILNDPGLGLALTLAYGASIIFGLGAVLATYDNPQNLFWLLVLYFTARALFRNEPWAWRPAGVAAGLGMLSKYSSVLLPGLVFLYLAAHPDRRTWLKRKEPWLAVLWAALVYAPNLYWNLAHGGAALRHTLAHTQGEWHVTTLDFLAEQAGMVGPILFVFLVIGWVRGIRSARRGSHPAAFLAWTSLPVFLLFLIISIKKGCMATGPRPRTPPRCCWPAWNFGR
jgi:4-amino-4-deoxy-L-arabinose transferase-like glycosyltransferase